MYSMDLYYNFFTLEPLRHELRTNMNTNTLKIILLLFVYSSFLSSVAAFQNVKSPKCTKIFWMMSPIYLKYNNYIFERLWNELR
jgi:hypothetical protein